jgi:DNA polymerase III subunit alpha
MKVYARLHSYYSLLRAVASPAALAAALAQQGYQAAVLTDTLSLSGAVAFFRACQAQAIQPIVGINLPFSYKIENNIFPESRLVLLVQNEAGWRNLCQLLSAIQFSEVQQQTLETLLPAMRRFNDGVICLTGGMEGPFYPLLKQGNQQAASDLLSMLRTIYNERFYYELDNQAPFPADMLETQVHFARSQQVPVLGAHVQWLLSPEQAELIPTLQAMRLNKDVNHLPPMLLKAEDTALLPYEQFERRFAFLPQALQNWQAICEQCRFSPLQEKTFFPSVDTPPGKSVFDVLKEKAYLGLRKKYEEASPAILQRLEYELSVIHQKGYESIFLIVQDILQYAYKQGIPTSSRGSAASSLVAYCLGITTPDPIKERLYFERFLNPERSSPPDIDTDICSRGREKLIAYLFEKYGAQYVAVVGTVNRLQPRSAVGNVAKALGCPPEKMRQLSKQFPHSFMAHFGGGSQTWIKEFEEKIRQSQSELDKKIYRQAMQLVELPDHFSQHAGGVVITPFPVAEWVPVQPSGSKNITITQFDHHDVEAMGLVKMDMLGIRGLTVLGDVAALLFTWRRLEFDSPLGVLEEIPDRDAQTEETINQGDTIGCFQIESPGMRSTLKEIGCRTMDGLMQALALYRPGPLQGGLHQTFIRRYRGQEPVTQLHPALSEILADSQGVILYQEQVLRIAHEIGGFSLAEADILRRAMSHFDPGKVMQTLKEKFIQGVKDQHDMDAGTADSIWQMMSAFAGYGFPKAHAASYARVAWLSAWCKTHYPAEFLCAVLANWGGYYGQEVYINEARRKGIPIHGPDLHSSEREFTTRYPQGEPTLYMGMNQIQRLTGRTIERILALRPFPSFEAFMMKVNPSRVEAENLIQVGACAMFGNIPTLMAQLNHQTRKQQQYALLLEQPEEVPDWPLVQKVKAQETLLGINMLCHPLELVAEPAARVGAVSIREAKTNPGETVRLAVLRQSWRRTRSQKRDMMAFVTLEDQTDMLDAVLFPAAYQRCQAVISAGGPFWVEGKFDRDETRGEVVFLIEKAGKL